MNPEQQARQQIDAKLVAAGWIVQDYKAFNPPAGTLWTSKKLGSAPASGAAADALVRRRERARASRPLPFLA